MLLTKIAQTPFPLQPSTIVFEYSFTVFNQQYNDTQKLIAAFVSKPSLTDWQQWLTGWMRSGYRLSSSPQLINVIH
jgi:hypothetical protein